MDKILLFSIIIVLIGLILMIAIDDMTARIISAVVVAVAILFNTADFYRFLPDSIIEKFSSAEAYSQEKYSSKKPSDTGNFILPTEDLLQGQWIIEDSAGTIAQNFKDDTMTIAMKNDTDITSQVGKYEIKGNKIIFTYTYAVLLSEGKTLDLRGQNKKEIYYAKFSKNGKILYFSFDSGDNYLPFTRME